MPRPARRYYSIGEVARLLGLEPHVLRFWEKEFRQIRPLRISGRRLYRAEHVELFQKIKKLLYEEGYTISGAKKKLNQRTKEADLLREIKEELLSIYRLLEGKDAKPSR
jgi:DNA-binding transcriptional MerR regulator